MQRGCRYWREDKQDVIVPGRFGVGWTGMVENEPGLDGWKRGMESRYSRRVGGANCTAYAWFSSIFVSNRTHY